MSQEIPTPPPPELEGSGADGDEKLPDLGAMGWRFGKTLLRKVADDRHGRRGTTARVLLRLATSQDVLREKPSSKNKFPPGFSKNRVLGPGSELSRDRKVRSKRNRSERKRDDSISYQTGPGGEPSLLSGSLKASRAGFSVEEMEAERANKRAKTSTGKSDSMEGEDTEKKE